MKNILLLIISVILAFLLSMAVINDASHTASSIRAAKQTEATAP